MDYLTTDEHKQLRERIEQVLIDTDPSTRTSIAGALAWADGIGIGTIRTAFVGPPPHGMKPNTLKMLIEFRGESWHHVPDVDGALGDFLESVLGSADADVAKLVGHHALVQLTGPSTCRLWFVFPKGK